MKDKESMGTLRFSREILVTPISDAASIFPWDHLRRAFRGMENVSFANNIYSFPFKLKRVVLSCDFAKSGSAAADFSVFTVIGVDIDDQYYLVNIWRKKGASYDEQISKIIEMRDSFEVNEIVVESNGFQDILRKLIEDRGIQNIKPFITDGKAKRDLTEGLPSLGAMFERGVIKFPYKEGETREMTELICSEFNSMAYNQDTGKFESTAGHDDTCMAIFIGITDLRQNKFTFKIDYV